MRASKARRGVGSDHFKTGNSFTFFKSALRLDDDVHEEDDDDVEIDEDVDNFGDFDDPEDVIVSLALNDIGIDDDDGDDDDVVVEDDGFGDFGGVVASDNDDINIPTLPDDVNFGGNHAKTLSITDAFEGLLREESRGVHQVPSLSFTQPLAIAAAGNPTDAADVDHDSMAGNANNYHGDKFGDWNDDFGEFARWVCKI